MGTARLFLANLTYRTTEENLMTDFEEIGRVTEASIVRDRDTKRSKGYGFITVNDGDEDKFLALHDYVYDGRRLIVKRAEKKPQADRPKLYKPVNDPTTETQSSGSETQQEPAQE